MHKNLIILRMILWKRNKIQHYYVIVIYNNLAFGQMVLEICREPDINNDNPSKCSFYQ